VTLDFRVIPLPHPLQLMQYTAHTGNFRCSSFPLGTAPIPALLDFFRSHVRNKKRTESLIHPLQTIIAVL
jgi:hypothetical protein